MKVKLSQDTGGGYTAIDTNRPLLDGSSAYLTRFDRPGGGGTCKVQATFPGAGGDPPSTATDTINC